MKQNECAISFRTKSWKKLADWDRIEIGIQNLQIAFPIPVRPIKPSLKILSLQEPSFYVLIIQLNKFMGKFASQSFYDLLQFFI